VGSVKRFFAARVTFHRSKSLILVRIESAYAISY